MPLSETMPRNIDPSTIFVSTQWLAENLASPDILVFDASWHMPAAKRDPRAEYLAGHIPGAVNRFFRDNLDEKTGRFKTLEQLRTEFSAILGNWESSQVIHQCGSGVTGCHNLFAFEIAGFGGGLLYPGSWSEWIAQADVPIEKN